MLKFMKNDEYSNDMIVYEHGPHKKTSKERIRGIYMAVDSLLSDIHPPSFFRKNNIENKKEMHESTNIHTLGMLTEIKGYLKNPIQLYKKNIEKKEKTLFVLTEKYFKHKNSTNETQETDADAYKVNIKILEIYEKIMHHVFEETREIKHNPMKTFSDLEEPSKKAEEFLKPLLEEMKSCIKKLPGM